MYFKKYAMGNNLSTVFFKNKTWAEHETKDNYAKAMFFP